MWSAKWVSLSGSGRLLIRELCHESGAEWVFHGAPASGAGAYGVLEENLVLVCWCLNEEHAKELKNQTIVRLSGDMCTLQTSFTVQAFADRATSLSPVKASAKSEAHKRKHHQIVDDDSSSSSSTSDNMDVDKENIVKGSKGDNKDQTKKDKKKKKDKKEKKEKIEKKDGTPSRKT